MSYLHPDLSPALRLQAQEVWVEEFFRIRDKILTNTERDIFTHAGIQFKTNPALFQLLHKGQYINNPLIQKRGIVSNLGLTTHHTTELPQDLIDLCDTYFKFKTDLQRGKQQLGMWIGAILRQGVTIKDYDLLFPEEMKQIITRSNVNILEWLSSSDKATLDANAVAVFKRTKEKNYGWFQEQVVMNLIYSECKVLT